MLLDRESFILSFVITSSTSQIPRYVWPMAWGPTYRNSYAITIANAGVTIIMAWYLRVHLRSLNLKLDKEEEEKGVKEKGFRYIL